jgi:hypothetical protein
MAASITADVAENIATAGRDRRRIVPVDFAQMDAQVDVRVDFTDAIRITIPFPVAVRVRCRDQPHIYTTVREEESCPPLKLAQNGHGGHVSCPDSDIRWNGLRQNGVGFRTTTRGVFDRG